MIGIRANTHDSLVPADAAPASLQPTRAPGTLSPLLLAVTRRQSHCVEQSLSIHPVTLDSPAADAPNKGQRRGWTRWLAAFVGSKGRCSAIVADLRCGPLRRRGGSKIATPAGLVGPHGRAHARGTED